MVIKEIKERLEKLSIEELHDINSFIEDKIESKNLGNIPVGETFEFLGEEFIVNAAKKTVNPCVGCAFYNIHYKDTCTHLCCSSGYRHDKRDVIFVKKDNIF